MASRSMRERLRKVLHRVGGPRRQDEEPSPAEPPREEPQTPAGDNDLRSAAPPAQPSAGTPAPEPRKEEKREDKREDKALRAQLKELAAALDRQREQTEAMLEGLGNVDELCVAIDKAADQVRKAAGTLPDRVAKAVGNVKLEAPDDEELAEGLRDLVAESRKQTDLLETMQSALTETRAVDEQTSAGLARLAETLESSRQTQAAHVELIEQIRDHLANSNADLVDAVDRQSGRLARAVLLAMAATAALAAAVLLQALLGG